MSCHVIYYENRAKKMRPVLTAAEYRNLRNTEKQKGIMDCVRRGDAKQKHHLLQMNYSCLPNEDGSLKGSTTPSDTVGMDVDFNPADPDYETRMAEVPQLVMSRKDLLGLLMLEHSATKGYHLAFRRRPELSQEENLRWASELLGVQFDKGAKDITRVFFTTTDEELLFLDEGLFDNTSQRSDVRILPREERFLTCVRNDKEAEERSDEWQKENCPLDYLGIPYAQIISKWWELHNDGQEPVKSNRDVLTYELAVNLRHICGFDRDTLDKVIPCYDEFPYEQKMKCIDSALGEKRTQMPKRLKDVLVAIRQEMLRDNPDAGAEVMAALDQAYAADELYHYDRLPKMPQGVSDSIDAVGHALAMPVLIAIAPAIGALATAVKLDVHGTARGLNLTSFVVGESASGKGKMDDIVAAWATELQAQADIFNEREKEWAVKASRMKSGEAPEQPMLPIRMLPLNNTLANLAERLANTKGKHALSYTPEADSVAQKWKQSISDFSVMVRQAYDESRYDREAKSADAVRVHIPKLLWNVIMCGTQDALYRVITNYTDGLLSRVAIARTPDNTYAPLDDETAQLTDLQSERIQQIAHLLQLLEGRVVLPLLEERGRAWLETIRREAVKNDDRVLARLRMRGCVNAQRITVALWLPKVVEQLIAEYGMAGAENRLKADPQLWIEMLVQQQTDEMMQLFDIIADYLIDNVLLYFRERIESAYENRNYVGNPQAMRGRRGKNDNIFDRLPIRFTYDQALEQTVTYKGVAVTRNSVHQMLKHWREQGLVCLTEDGDWKKLC